MWEEAYSGIWEKAAALLQSIVKSHAFDRGNRRLGWLATAVFLDLNSVEVAAIPNEDIYRFVLGVAEGHHEIQELAAGSERIAL